jgi:ribosomal protein L14E/L6E/L27E
MFQHCQMGKKVVVIKQLDEGTKERPYPHAIIDGSSSGQESRRNQTARSTKVLRSDMPSLLGRQAGKKVVVIPIVADIEWYPPKVTRHGGE